MRKAPDHRYIIHTRSLSLAGFVLLSCAIQTHTPFIPSGYIVGVPNNRQLSLIRSGYDTVKVFSQPAHTLTAAYRVRKYIIYTITKRKATL